MIVLRSLGERNGMAKQKGGRRQGKDSRGRVLSYLYIYSTSIQLVYFGIFSNCLSHRCVTKTELFSIALTSPCTSQFSSYKINKFVRF